MQAYGPSLESLGITRHSRETTCISLPPSDHPNGELNLEGKTFVFLNIINEPSFYYTIVVDNSLIIFIVCSKHCSGIDDDEIDTYLLTESESLLKERFWMKVNGDHMREVEKRLCSGMKVWLSYCFTGNGSEKNKTKAIKIIQRNAVGVTMEQHDLRTDSLLVQWKQWKK